jgi:hypothetical protein
MKKLLPILLVLSLAANAALFFRSSSRSGAAAPSKTSATSSSTDKSPSASNAKLPDNLAAVLATGDIAALTAAGFSPEDARAITIGRAYAKFNQQMRAARPASKETDEKYWRGSPFSNYNKMAPEQRAAMNKAQRELGDAMRTTFGDDASFNSFGDNRMGFLSTGKRDELRRIDEDYNEMRNDIYREQEGVPLASDRAKAKLLQEEKERDIAAALSPEEYEQYQLHASQTANNIRARYGDAIQSEADYKKIFTLQKAFDAQYPNDMFLGGPRSQEEVRARSEAQRKLNEDIHTALGEENYAAFQRANDTDYRTLTSLQNRLKLPAGTVDQVYSYRETYAAQSQQINANSDLTPQQRREQLTALANQAKNDLAAKLGQEGADAYAQRAQWLQMLKNGTAFSTNPKDAQAGGGGLGNSVYPLRPSRSAEQPRPAAPAP